MVLVLPIDIAKSMSIIERVISIYVKKSSTCKHQKNSVNKNYIDRMNHNHITYMTKITLNDNE